MAHLYITETVLADRRLPLPGRVVVLGRSLDVDVPLPHRSVSRRHALIEYGAAGYSLSDLGSSNGTFLGDRRLESGERVPLPLGVPFRLGDLELLLVPDEVLERESPSPAAAAPRPAPVVPAKPRRPAATATRKPSPARRATMYRERRQAMRWFGVIVTVVLLAVAGVFLVKIVKNTTSEGEKKDQRPSAAEPAGADSSHEIVPLTVPGEGK